MRDTRLFAAGILLVVAGPALADSPLSRFSFGEPHMGTWFKITLYAADKQTAQHAAAKAFERIAELDRMLTDYNSESELMRLCQKSGGPPVRVSHELFFVLKRAQEVTERSGGAFDVTVGPIVRLWRRARRTGRLPDPQQVADARALVGYQRMRLDERAQTVQLLKSGMRLDLGGIAKGYAADEALLALKAPGNYSCTRGRRRRHCGRRSSNRCTRLEHCCRPPGRSARQALRPCDPAQRRHLHVRRHGAVRGNRRQALLAHY